MIADTAVMASPWCTDGPLVQDVGDIFIFTPEDIDLETDLERYRWQKDFTLETLSTPQDAFLGIGLMESENCIISPSDSYGDAVGLHEDWSPILINALDGSDVSDSLDLASFAWEDESVSSIQTLSDSLESSECGEAPSFITQSSPQTRHQRHRRKCLGRQKWEDLSFEEQTSVVEELSRVISSELGLREQLEVIKIISPKATILPTDREFTIDVSSLNGDKLNRIRQYIQAHSQSCFLECSKENRQTSSSHKKQTKTNVQKICKVSEKRNQQKRRKQQQRERKSGLFMKEEVLALSVCEATTEEEIDILG